jgi:formylglycine-generating enzyme required for sulfatase activity
VGRRVPNAWGLFDMHANVREWVSGNCGTYHRGDVTEPPTADEGDRRAWRGGSWADLWNYCRSGYRNAHDVGTRRCEYIGIRVCAPLA